MNLLINIFFLIFVFLLSGCADYKTTKNNKNAQKKFYSSNGFALVYDDNLFATGGINKKIKNNDDIVIMHSFLKRNTPVQIINPTNSKVVVSKVMSRAEYPSFFNIVLSKKIAEILELDILSSFCKRVVSALRCQVFERFNHEYIVTVTECPPITIVHD